jgi:hypothetical protein
MPIYVYQIITPADDGPFVEILQRLGEPALTHHPESGQPIRKLITAPNLTLLHGERGVKSSLSEGNLARHGFTKYERAAKGHYVKTGGDTNAPRELRAD